MGQAAVSISGLEKGMDPLDRFETYTGGDGIYR